MHVFDMWDVMDSLLKQFGPNATMGTIAQYAQDEYLIPFNDGLTVLGLIFSYKLKYG